MVPSYYAFRRGKKPNIGGPYQLDTVRIGVPLVSADPIITTLLGWATINLVIEGMGEAIHGRPIHADANFHVTSNKDILYG